MLVFFEVYTLMFSSRTIRPEHVVRSVYKATGCTDNPNHHVIYLEHVVVRITITHPRRGDLSINLTSPSGTKSQLLANRYRTYCECSFSKVQLHELEIKDQFFHFLSKPTSLRIFFDGPAGVCRSI